MSHSGTEALRVLHVIPSIAEDEGGPSAAVRTLATSLAAADVDVTLATTRWDDADHAGARLHGSGGNAAGTLLLFETSLPGGWKYSRALFRWLRTHVGEYQVVHVHAFFSYSSVAATRAARRAGVPYVIRPIGSLDPWSLRQGSWKKRLFMWLAGNRMLREAAAIQVTSEAERRALEALGHGARTRLVPLGVELGPLRESPLPRSGRGVRVLFLSRLHPGKGVALLLETLALVNSRSAEPVQLAVAGGGQPSYRKQLEGISKELGISDHVRFEGHVSGRQKRDLLESSDIFVLASQHENFGLAVVEALAAGLPVVVSAEVGVAPAIEEAGAGFVVPRTAAGIAEVLRQLSGDPGLRHRMGRSARRLAEARFSANAAAAGLIQLYGELSVRDGPTVVRATPGVEAVES